MTAVAMAADDDFDARLADLSQQVDKNALVHAFADDDRPPVSRREYESRLRRVELAVAVIRRDIR